MEEQERAIEVKTILEKMNDTDTKMTKLRTECFESVISTYSQMIDELEVNIEEQDMKQYEGCEEIGMSKYDIDSEKLISEHAELARMYDANPNGTDAQMYQDIALIERRKRMKAEKELEKIKLELECMKQLDDANQNLQVTYKDMLVNALFLK